MITRVEKHAEKSKYNTTIVAPSIFYQITGNYQCTYPNLSGHPF